MAEAEIFDVNKISRQVNVGLTEADYLKLVTLASKRNMKPATLIRDLVIRECVGVHMQGQPERKPALWTTQVMPIRTMPFAAKYMQQYRTAFKTEEAGKAFKRALAHFKETGRHPGMYRFGPKRRVMTYVTLDGALLTTLDKYAAKYGLPLRSLLGILLHVGINPNVSEGE